MVRAIIDWIRSMCEKNHYTYLLYRGMRALIKEGPRSALVKLKNFRARRKAEPGRRGLFRRLLDRISILFGKNYYTYLFYRGMRALIKEGPGSLVKRTKDFLWRKAGGRIITYKLSHQERARQESTRFSRDVKFSILVPLFNTPEKFLHEMIASVREQSYGNWELCLADGSDASHDKVERICRRYAAEDKRILYRKIEKNLGISGNTNVCIDMATGDYIALFDHDDLLHPAALYEMMHAICDEGADFIYTDEATFLSPDRKKILTIHCKPDYAIDNLRANNYICHFNAFSRELLNQAGRFRSEYDGSQDHDMMLRLAEKAKKIVHIPKVLYFWRSHPQSVAQDISAKTYAIDAGKRAVGDSIARCGEEAQIESSRAFPTIYRIKYALRENAKVSILIPTKDHLSDLKRCVESIVSKTTYTNYEVILVDSGSDDKDVLKYYDQLRGRPNFSIYSMDEEFNHSRLINFAATKASGKYYILLNDDTEVITPEWIEEMLMYVQRPDVAAAGAMLYYPDHTIQHAGIIVGMGRERIAGRAFYHVQQDSIGYMGKLCYAQDVSAVTAACMMIKASVFQEIGGFDEEFRVAYNDVDLCMRIRRAGYLIVWTPYAQLYHYESETRGSDESPERLERLCKEAERFKACWNEELAAGDPYYNPNFSLDRSDFYIGRSKEV